MSASLRRALYIVFGLLWLSGCIWLMLHFFFQTESDFGSAPHPWQAPLMVFHGIAATIGVFLFGWVIGNHVEARWRRSLNRTTGLTLVTAVGVLALTGLGSYYLTADSWRIAAAWTHELLGALAIIPALIHWRLKTS